MRVHTLTWMLLAVALVSSPTLAAENKSNVASGSGANDALMKDCEKTAKLAVGVRGPSHNKRLAELINRCVANGGKL